MGNKQNKKKSISEGIPKNSNSIPVYDGFFLFFWKEDNRNKKKDSDNWSLFSLEDEEKLEMTYQIYLKKKQSDKFKEKEFRNISLNNPHENIIIDLIDFKRFNKKNPKTKFEVIRKRLTIEYIEENLLEKDDNLYTFFWKADINPFNKSSIGEWSPYDLEDQYILKLAYALYRKNPYYDKGEIKKPNDHFINFQKMMQICKSNSFRQRPIIRSIPESVTNIVRINTP